MAGTTGLLRVSMISGTKTRATMASFSPEQGATLFKSKLTCNYQMLKLHEINSIVGNLTGDSHTIGSDDLA